MRCAFAIIAAWQFLVARSKRRSVRYGFFMFSYQHHAAGGGPCHKPTKYLNESRAQAKLRVTTAQLVSTTGVESTKFVHCVKVQAGLPTVETTTT